MIYELWENDEIIGFSEGSLVAGNNNQFIKETSYKTMSDYQDRFNLSCTKPVILANGVDKSIVTLYSNTDDFVISIEINGIKTDVEIINHQFQMEITSSIPEDILIRPYHRNKFSMAGRGSLIIRSIES